MDIVMTLNTARFQYIFQIFAFLSFYDLFIFCYDTCGLAVDWAVGFRGNISIYSN